MRLRMVASVLVAGLIGTLPSAFAKAEPDARWLEKSREPGVTPLRRAACEQIARIRICEITFFMRPGGFDILRLKADEQSPTDALYKMGIEVLPVLVEALDDATPTTVLEPDRFDDRLKPTRWNVNQLVWRLIGRIAGRQFVITDGPEEIWEFSKNPQLVPRFKEVVLEWYRGNKDRTIEQRKIADLGDPFFRNRMDAAEWLGKQRSTEAVPAIAKYLNDTLDGEKKSSLVDSEVAGAALALGQIGDKDARPAVIRACNHFSEDFTRPRGSVGFFDVGKYFQAEQGRALLGEKDKSLQELNRIYRECSERMEPSTRKEYQELLKSAEQW
jgi:hypothetical protein